MGLDLQGIDHVTLPVMYLKRSVEFYGEVLGLRQTQRPDQTLQGAWFAVTETQQVRLIYSVGWTGDSIPMHHHFALRVGDLDAAIQYLESTGWPFSESKNLPHGLRCVFLKDPDGHVVEICQSN